MELITLPRSAGGYVSFRATRQEVELWGAPVALLLYSGPLAAGQSERNDGRYSLVTIPRDPSRETQFLQREVWPAIGSPFMSAGGFKGLPPEAVPEPDDPRLETLERNLLRAAWHPLAVEMGLMGTGPSTGRGTRDGWRRLQSLVISEEERNGFLHEAQHALDEAWKVQPEHYAQVALTPVEAEMRASLAALAHSGSPHYELYQWIRQYRQLLPHYAEAVGTLLGDLSAQVLAAPERYEQVRVKRNVVLQLPRLLPDQLRQLAATSFQRRFAAADRSAGYNLTYQGRESAAGGLNVGEARGWIQAADLPAPGDAPGPAAFWGIEGSRVVTAGVHLYLSASGVRPAQADDAYGLAVGATGYMALLMPAGAGPWRFDISGGLFAADGDENDSLPLRILAGDAYALELKPQSETGTFSVEIPAEAASDGILRLVLSGRTDSQAAAFVTGFQLTTPAR